MGDEKLVQLDVLGVRRQAPSDQVVVLLLDLDGHRLLPIVVGVAEGSSIAAAQSGISAPRPMTHDLLVSVVKASGRSVVQAEVVSLVDGVFHAVLVLDNGVRVDSRASDAIAVAVRTGSPVLCVPAVLEEAGLEVEQREPETEVQEFRAFLDTVSADDFGSEGDDPQSRPPS
ncbi:bifunctional nuclease family protein [Actinotalea sp. C106]|uniref:bifunctional nuclease family protein n=1 Tax=Actinotalea sp. C106 TaxID=2908644 RepID=UPI00202836CF|nr:bifunctional nuclease family protein [Actinotalea sp. C106]